MLGVKIPAPLGLEGPLINIDLLGAQKKRQRKQDDENRNEFFHDVTPGIRLFLFH